MEPERYQRLKDLFIATADATDGERRAALEALASEDAALADHLRAMLAAHGRSDDLLAESRIRSRETGDPAGDVAGVGLRIGAFRTLRELGRGGMGTVYLAERDDGSFNQRVAIKVIKRGMDTDEIIRRFVAERQILAQLVHPNIARLLDGGSTDDGRPFFVLEHVEGKPIGAYCAERQLGLEARLRLFLEVCAAVAFAHRNLVVHRDLKPANIVVDTDGVPKLLDFGIAKLLAPSSAEPTLTVAGGPLAPLTPDYASPEQLAGGPVTTATDVHGLGLLLHELLTGWAPAVAARRLGTETIRLPSKVVRALGAPTAAIEAPRLARRLEGDLDTIVLKAIDPEPERRYASARELAEDLERHLANQPVKARRPTLAYRLGRSIRRHRVGSAFLLAVLVSAALALYQAAQIRRQRDHAERQRQRAEAVSSFLVSLFKAADPTRSRGANVPVREVLDQGLRQLRDPAPAAAGRPSLASEPATRAYLLHVVGEVLDQLGVEDEARQAFVEAQALREKLAGPEAELELAATLTMLADVLRQRGSTIESEALYRRALEIRRQRLDGDSPALAESLNGLALLRRAQGDSSEAETLLREAITLWRRAGPEAEIELAASLSNLGALRLESGDVTTAPALLAEAREIRRRRLDRRDPRMASGLHNLGVEMFQLGKFDAAADLLGEAAELRRSVLGTSHPDLAVTLTALATVEDRRGKLDAVETAQREALAILQQSYTGPQLDVADAQLGLASVLRKKGELAAALAPGEAAVALYRALPGDHRAEVANALNTLGLIQRDRGQLELAESLAREGLELRRAARGPEHPDVASSLNALASVLHLRGRLEEASRAYSEAVALRRRLLPAGHPALAASLFGLGSVLCDRGAGGEAPLREALAVLRASTSASGSEIERVEARLVKCVPGTEESMGTEHG